MPREKLSVLIPTFNVEPIIRDCLETVRWADEILICDSFSTDRTLDVCREYTDRIVQHEYVNSAKQKNWAIPQCTHAWVLIIDSDERLEPGLREEIEDVLTHPDPEYDAYRIARKNLVFGQWVKTCGMYPDYVTRLFRRDRGRYEDKEVHAHLHVPGMMGTLKHHFLHHDYTDISSYLIKFERYMRYEADQLQKTGRVFRWWSITLRPMAMFLWTYIYQGGYRDGFRGLFLSAVRAFYNFMMYAELWEREWRAQSHAYQLRKSKEPLGAREEPKRSRPPA